MSTESPKTKLVHPAHGLPFDELVERLRDARDRRLVYERSEPDGLVLYVYSDRCVYEAAWDEVTVAARGLILDPNARRIVATPFPKFFNLGEGTQVLPDLPFETTEKIDGSLIIIFHHEGRWRTATKGAFDSWQAVWAADHLSRTDLAALQPGVTYLAEAIHPENRIVVRYEQAELVLLAAYRPDGTELRYADVGHVATALGWRAAQRASFASMAELVAHARQLPRSEEGFVLRFDNGLRLKVKGDEYRRIHALISRVTPLAMWEALAAGDDMEAIRRELPEEFWGDFDDIVGLLQSGLARQVERIATAARGVAHLSDKELGLQLATLDEDIRGFIFAYRKSGGNLMSGRSLTGLLRVVRPTGNVLPGYVPSYAMNRLQEEAG